MLFWRLKVKALRTFLVCAVVAAASTKFALTTYRNHDPNWGMVALVFFGLAAVVLPILIALYDPNRR